MKSNEDIQTGVLRPSQNSDDMPEEQIKVVYTYYSNHGGKPVAA